MTTEKNSGSASPLYIGGNGNWSFWPPKIVWSRTRGWLNIQDPVDGTWFSIEAKGAPRGWTKLANLAKYGRP
jgi:hypothetical protein